MDAAPAVETAPVQQVESASAPQAQNVSAIYSEELDAVPGPEEPVEADSSRAPPFEPVLANASLKLDAAPESASVPIPTLVVEKTAENQPSFGETPGKTEFEQEGFEKRQADATPDEVKVVPEPSGIDIPKATKVSENVVGDERSEISVSTSPTAQSIYKGKSVQETAEEGGDVPVKVSENIDDELAPPKAAFSQHGNESGSIIDSSDFPEALRYMRHQEGDYTPAPTVAMMDALSKDVSKTAETTDKPDESSKNTGLCSFLFIFPLPKLFPDSVANFETFFTLAEAEESELRQRKVATVTDTDDKTTKPSTSEVGVKPTGRSASRSGRPSTRGSDIVSTKQSRGIMASIWNTVFAGWFGDFGRFLQRIFGRRRN